MAKLLGIDIGTSSAKAVLYDADAAQVIATASEEYPVNRPAPDQAEQNPDDWWQASVNVVRQVTANEKDIAAIGLSGQMHGGTFLHPTGEILHPAVIWPDTRSANEVTQLLERVGHERYPQITGTLPAVGFMAPTLLWMHTHTPDVLEKTAAFLLPKDYVHYKLSGEMTTEPSDAAATGLFDVEKAAWSTEIMAAMGINPEITPRVIPSAEMLPLTAQAAEQLGLAAGIPVAAGSADQPAQALGNGILAPGVVSITVGSGGQVFSPLTTVKTDPRLHVFNHALPGTFYALGAILAAGLSLRWLRDILDVDYAALSAEAANAPAGADGLMFLPYLNGERTPHMDPHARGGFIGLSSYHTRAHLARAVMEGVAFAVRQAVEITQELGGSVQTIIGSGGGVEADVWRGILVDVIGLPLRKSLMKEQTGVGAAALAGVGAGVYASFDEMAARVAIHGEPYHPDAARHGFYNERYEQFTALYPTLKADLNRLAQS